MFPNVVLFMLYFQITYKIYRNINWKMLSLNNVVLLLQVLYILL